MFFARVRPHLARRADKRSVFTIVVNACPIPIQTVKAVFTHLLISEFENFNAAHFAGAVERVTGVFLVNQPHLDNKKPSSTFTCERGLNLNITY